ncbi:MAG: FAD-dependent oxidoreductase [Bacteroidales bacterium]|jgi:all-trans-retinol 13,14-reductase|nr:FAD-dependent oxidoreductase [Bacteroidales bacterium]
MKYDVVIIGSGLGGLLCGTILSREGYSVCMVEKNARTGGCLQSMRRGGHVFNTGIHYMGSLDKGQILHQYFKYFGLIGKIDVQRLDENGFDVIGFGSDGAAYPLAMGTGFVDSLAKHFPDERHALEQYAAKLKDVCRSLPFYALDDKLYGAVLDKPYIGICADEYLRSMIGNTRLQEILSGNDLMYGIISDKTSLLLYSLINHSFTESAWRMAGDSEQIGNALADEIRAAGGTIICRRTAERFVVEKGTAKAVVLHTGEEIEGTQFISNAHPQITLRMIAEGDIRKSYRMRIENMQNSSGIFVLHVALKERTFPFCNHIYYHYNRNHTWPSKFMMTPAGNERDGYAQAVSLLANMDFAELKPWEHTTVGHRDAGYQELKTRKARQLIEAAEQHFPGFGQMIAHQYTSTPLSYRDYTGTPEGAAYGVLKDCNRPLSTMVFPRTGISNLLLTGQNVYFHGMLGVSIGAAATCSELLGAKYLIDKIKGS